MAKRFHTYFCLRHAMHVIALCALTLLTACNSKDEPKNDIDYVAAQNVAVTKFTLQPNAGVMSDLDSVYFSIDLKNKVIYNADSLPPGTQVNKLVPVITYPSTVGSAEITMTGGTTRTGTVDYISNPSDSIDFTGKVALKLTSLDGNVSATYQLKVNVHKCEGDSLMWDNIAVAPLPARNPNPKTQRTVATTSKTVSLIEEANGEYTIASCNHIADNDWNVAQVNFSFTPQVRTLNAVGSDLYILDNNDNLYKSTDLGSSWSDCGVDWINIIGEFDGQILGISNHPTPTFDIYPRPQDFTPSPLPPDFPTQDFSNFNTFSSKWSDSAIGFLSGGSRNGTALSHTWGYDGINWAKISDTPLPALRDAVIIPYFSYKKTTALWIQTEYSVWICMGGRLADGSINDKVYISYDNGVYWRIAPQQMQLPDFVHPGYSADAILNSTPMHADLNDSWKKVASVRRAPQLRLSYTIDGDNIDWECPFIYLFGGINKEGVPDSQIRRAVLARLTFTPLF